MTEEFDPTKIDISSWGKSEGPKKPSKKSTGSKKENLENSDSDQNETRNTKKVKENPLELLVKQLSEKVQQLESQLQKSQPSPKKMVEKPEIQAYLEQNGSKGIVDWIFGNKTTSRPNGFTRVNELSTLTLMVNYFLFKQ